MGNAVRAKNADAFVGCGVVELIDRGAGFPMTILYPTPTAGRKTMIGPYFLDAVQDAPLDASTRRPLVLLSHGSGGEPVLYRTLALHLAHNGFVVGMPEHPGNNLKDNTLNGTIENLIGRPRHIHTALDWFFENETFRDALCPGPVPIIGHSMGGYTALAAAGGIPTALPHEAPGGRAHRIPETRDPRIGPLVLLAPATVWFRETGALAGVDAPVLMLFGDRDSLTPPEFHAEVVLNGVSDRDKVQYRIVENAGHFSFLSPFPPFMSNAAFLPSQDPPGFDRASFLNELNVEVLSFLTGAPGRTDGP
ncbi:MAG: alpha/beta hydrolase [Synergistaceae bacterium]|jgi:predicted dienelactone hydrolase|nr:alpha/beta hydrolase [Synergistaceae bacterium]